MSDPGPLDEVRQMLAAIPYFSHVDEAVLDVIAKAAIRRTFEADQVVLMEGEPSAGLFVVQTGWLKSVKGSPQGREQVMRVVGPGEVFNAIGALASATNPGTVIALEPATVWILPRDHLLKFLQEYPSLSSMVVQALAGRVQHLMDQVEDLSLRNVEARLARFLLEEAQQGTVERKRWETQAELASRLGTVPNVLNRALRRLTEDDIIQMDRQHIQILDPAQLARIAEIY
jgi:CRP/FNR family cyclic AMP-dependent transcriptional regulator